jgi:glycosidase
LHCAPAPTLPLPSTPPSTALSPDSATSLPGPQDPAATPVPGTPMATVPSQPASMAWQDQIVYVLIPHKFYDGNPSNNYMKDQYDLPNPDYDGGFLGGDIAGIHEQMPYLKSLGITAVLIYPVFCNDEKPFFRYLPTGYNVRDYQCIDPNFGTNEEFRQLIEEFHSTANGPRINVILDLPISTTGHEHPWRMNPGYYRPWNDENPEENLGCSAGYCEPYVLPDGTGVDHSSSMPVLNHTAGLETGTGPYAEIRDTIFWLVDTFDIDGFRYDSAHNFYPAFWVKFMSDFHGRYDQTRPDFWHLAEVFVWPPDKKSWQIPAEELVNQTSSVGPIRMDSVYDFALQAFIQETFAKGADPNCLPIFCESLLGHLVSTQRFEHPERLMAQVDGYESASFLKVPEQSGGKENLYLAVAFLLTSNRVPLIYSGNEFGIDYAEPGALFASGLDETYHENFKKLIQIARDTKAFRRGSLTELDTTSNIISYARQHEGETFIVVLNNAPASQSLRIDLKARAISCSRVKNLLLENDPNIQLDNNESGTVSLSVHLKPWESKIIHCEPWKAMTALPTNP